MSKPLTEGKTRANVKRQEDTNTRPIVPPPIKPSMSKREQQWRDFSDVVSKHLREYTVPQYGDVGEDEVTNYTVKDCVNNISRYIKRYGSQRRENQQELDFIKIAHYSCLSYTKEKHKNKPKEIDNIEHGLLLSPTDKKYKDMLGDDRYELTTILIDNNTELHWFKIKEIN